MEQPVSCHELYDEYLVSYFWDTLSLPDIDNAFLSKWKKACFFHPDVLKGPNILTPDNLPHNPKLRIDTVRYTSSLQESFQKYMDKIADRLYAANPEILGKRSPLVFELNCNLKKADGFQFFYQNPPKISTTLADVLLYENEDSLAGNLAHELVHVSIFLQNNYPTISTKAEEATADILGLIILARAGYFPVLMLDNLFKYNPDINPLLRVFKTGKVSIPLTQQDLIGIQEAAQTGLIKTPLFMPKTKKCLNPPLHPHSAVRFLYQLQLNADLYNHNIIKNKDPNTHATPIDTSFRAVLQRHISKSNHFFCPRTNKFSREHF